MVKIFESVYCKPKTYNEVIGKIYFYCLKTIDQFERDGCDNCEKFLHIKNDREFVMTCTSSNFDG